MPISTMVSGLEILTDSLINMDYAYSYFPTFIGNAERFMKMFQRKKFDTYISESVLGLDARWLWPPGRGYNAQVSDDNRFMVVNRSMRSKNVVTVVSGPEFENVWDLPISTGIGFCFFGTSYLAVQSWDGMGSHQITTVFDLKAKTMIGSFSSEAIG